MLNFAKLISFFLGPVFILFPVPFILVSRFTQDYNHAFKWTIFSYAFIVAIALFVSVGVLFGIFSNFDVSKREQRPLLFLASALAAFCYFLSLVIPDGPKILYVGFLAVVLGLIAIIVINRWVKASVHLATATSVILFVSIVYKGYFFLLLLLIPLLAWARIKTKEHTLKETVIGTVLGIVITLTVYFVSKEFLLDMFYN